MKTIANPAAYGPTKPSPRHDHVKPVEPHKPRARAVEGRHSEAESKHQHSDEAHKKPEAFVGALAAAMAGVNQQNAPQKPPPGQALVASLLQAQNLLQENVEGEGLGDVLFCGKTQMNQNLPQQPPLFFLDREGLLELFLGDHPPFDEEFS